MFQADADRVVVRPFPMTSPNEALSPLTSTTLTGTHVSEALAQSSDNGATLDLANRGLTDVGESGAEELATIGRGDLAQGESSVLRLALGSNRLTTLPMAFALLSRLRYLNLKNNSFSVFPDVVRALLPIKRVFRCSLQVKLTVMPSLEILDISRNKLKKLPSQPGSLHNIRVLCLSRNKLSRLPPYFSKLHHLNIFKIDHNPLDWPPKSVMARVGSLDDARAMKDWIRGFQKWMEEGGSKHAEHVNGEDSINSDHPMCEWPRFALPEYRSTASLTPHARSFSMDSTYSVYSSPSPNGVSEFSLSTSSLPERPQPLTIGHATPYSASALPPHSPDSYLPSPEHSDSSDDGSTAVNGDRPRKPHLRNASLTPGLRLARPRKSLPDLRNAKFPFPTAKVPNLPGRKPQGTSSNRAYDDFSIPSPLSMRQDSNSSDGHFNPRPLRALPREPVSPRTVEQPSSIEIERNSYFRRFSTLPTSSITKTLPPSLLSLIDAARSILFAVCQVYQTLEHYTVFAIDDRLSSVLKKVLDPASADMMQLINSLDRFDTMSRKSLPSPTICRSVVESCKNTVAVFGKAVGVLALQLKVLESQDDVRYLRHMVLVLYGATAEVSHAWQLILPHVDTVKPMLRDRSRPNAKPFVMTTSPEATTGYGMHDHDAYSPSHSRTFSDDLSPGSFRAVTTKGWSPSVARLRTTRRHAGSFSSRDVEIGKKLPSYEEPPPVFGVLSGPASETAIPRVGKRFLGSAGSTSTTTSSSIPSNAHAFPLGLRQSHSRQGSQTSLTASSSASSPGHGPVSSSLDLPPNSKKLVDKEALDAMKVAVEAAPSVWEMMEDILGDILETQANIRQLLTRAKAVTHRLRESIRAVQQGDSTADRKQMRDDAHVFVKNVVQLSNVIKHHGAGHASYPTLRSKMVTLTNSTEEFVILLHVSSFSPSSTPRPYSPMMNGSSVTITGGVSPAAASPDENRQPSSLSPSRSTQAELSAGKRKLALPARDGEVPPGMQPFGGSSSHYPRLGGGLPWEVSVTPG